MISLTSLKFSQCVWVDIESPEIKEKGGTRRLQKRESSALDGEEFAALPLSQLVKTKNFCCCCCCCFCGFFSLFPQAKCFLIAKFFHPISQFLSAHFIGHDIL